jgi:L-lactate dehydrogenase
MENAVHSNPPGPSGMPVRLPGERGLALREIALKEGVALHPSIPPMLEQRAKKANIEAPKAR